MNRLSLQCTEELLGLGSQDNEDRALATRVFDTQPKGMIVIGPDGDFVATCPEWKIWIVAMAPVSGLAEDLRESSGGVIEKLLILRIDLG